MKRFIGINSFLIHDLNREFIFNISITTSEDYIQFR